MMDDELRLIERFHGHLGPYALLGYRMGQVANRELGAAGKGKSAVVFTGLKPPTSCLVDGIQLSSGCTLGKGNIAVEDRGQAAARFADKLGKWIEVSLLQAVSERIAESFRLKTEHALCHELWKATDNALFKIERGGC